MKRTGLFAAVLILHSCGSNSAEETDLKTDENEIVKDTIEDIQVETETISTGEIESETYYLDNYFSGPIVGDIEKMNNHFNSCEDLPTFKRVIELADYLVVDMESNIFEYNTPYLQEWKDQASYIDPMELMGELYNLKDETMPISAECGAECVDMIFLINFSSLHELAKNTDSPEDDSFMEIVLHFYGPYGTFNQLEPSMGWRDQWSDFDMAWTVGNDYLFNGFKKIKTHKVTYPNGTFDKELNDLDLLFGRFIPSGGQFQYSRDEVLDEYQKILDLDVLSAKTTTEMKKVYSSIETGSSGEFSSE